MKVSRVLRSSSCQWLDVVAMEYCIPLPLRKLTKLVANLGRNPKTPPKIQVANMADQEEDFSSLPLPDRFQHKV